MANLLAVACKMSLFLILRIPATSLLPILLLSLARLRTTASFSAAPSSPSPPPQPPPKYIFRTFDFHPQTGICRRPSSFQHKEEGKDTQYFVMRNTPGDGDCVFHAALSSVFISMGMINPDAVASTTSSMALEMRKIVANILATSEGNLYVNKQENGKLRVVRCRDLLRSAANSEGLSTEDYLSKLRQPGKEGGLYGGGPELTVLSNVLRRPISIYHLKPNPNSDAATDSSMELKRMGVFGDGLFEDPGGSIPNSVVSNAVFFTIGGPKATSSQMEDSLKGSSLPISSPWQCKWHLHILIADANEKEKHATLLLPSLSILHNNTNIP